MYKLPITATDLTNKKFNKLLVLRPTKKEGIKGLYWVCKCDCGKECITRGHSLKNNLTKSCGCLKKEMLIKRNKIHNGKKCFLYKHVLSLNKDYQANRLLLRRYGITTKQYNDMYLKQNKVCKICGNTSNKLAVDHDHSTNKVRGLVCYKCNNILLSFDMYNRISKDKILFNKIQNYLL